MVVDSGVPRKTAT